MCNIAAMRAHPDAGPVVCLILLPFLVAAPQLAGWLAANPMLYIGQLGVGVVEGILRGVPYADPNSGFGTQALERLAAVTWLQGEVPWWNYYSGVGLPLIAEYQAAAFFPLTFLMLLPVGPVLQQCALQSLSGLGTYALLRQLGLHRFTASVGGLLYAFNGVLAWHSHAPATALPFLPFMLWGVERAYACGASGLPGGWKPLAGAMMLGLLCSFPETSYLSGLLALAWAVIRGLQCPKGRKLGYAARIVGGGLVGIAVAAPQVYAFFHYLPHAHIGDHTGMGHAYHHRTGILTSLLAPYAFGPIFGYAWGKPELEAMWGGIGGFATAALFVTAAYGFWLRRDAIAWLLIAWIVSCVGRTFGIEPFHTLVNLVPGITFTAFGRYAPASWILALVILATRGLDHAFAGRASVPGAWKASALVSVTAIAAAIAMVIFWRHLYDRAGMRNAAIISLVWLTLSVVLAVWWLRQGRPGGARRLGTLLAIEAVLMTFIPTLSNPRGGEPDIPAIHFLRNNLGLSRFYTLGPIEPNYGAFFRVASINHNYLPVSRRWVEFVRAHLDRHANPVVFNGSYRREPGEPPQSDELRRNLAAYQWVGVKYVVTYPDADPLSGVAGVRRVYRDGVLAIHELPDPAPYFESPRCAVEAVDRGSAVVKCPSGGVLVRRELYFPGWRATVNGVESQITMHRELFQEIALPAGRSEVRFSYAPPHIGWAWLAAAVGLLALAFPFRRVRPPAPSGRSAT